VRGRHRRNPEAITEVLLALTGREGGPVFSASYFSYFVAASP
jgi:hypothetical protein